MLRKTGNRKDVSFEVIFRTCLNNLIAHYILEEESLSHSLSTRLIASYKKWWAGISIAVIIHSFDRTLEEINPKGWCAVRTLHIAIALAIRSLHTRGRISIALVIHSFDRTLEEINPIHTLEDSYRTRYRFLDRILITPKAGLSHSHPIALYKKSTPKAGAQGISIALVIHSLDRTLHIAIHSLDRLQ